MAFRFMVAFYEKCFFFLLCGDRLCAMGAGNEASWEGFGIYRCFFFWFHYYAVLSYKSIYSRRSKILNVSLLSEA